MPTYDTDLSSLILVVLTSRPNILLSRIGRPCFWELKGTVWEKSNYWITEFGCLVARNQITTSRSCSSHLLRGIQCIWQPWWRIRVASEAKPMIENWCPCTGQRFQI